MSIWAKKFPPNETSALNLPRSGSSTGMSRAATNAGTFSKQVDSTRSPSLSTFATTGPAVVSKRIVSGRSFD